MRANFGTTFLFFKVTLMRGERIERIELFEQFVYHTSIVSLVCGESGVGRRACVAKIIINSMALVDDSINKIMSGLLGASLGLNGKHILFYYYAL